MQRSGTRCVVRPLFSLVTSFVMVAAASARADDASDTAAARVLGGDGVLLADAGDCQGAIEKLRRAEDLHHAPTTAGRLGECEIALGRLVAGTERLQRLLREPSQANPPAPFVEALARARRVLDRAFPRIATMRVSVRAPAGTTVSVTVDGERLPDALLDADRPADPGRHTVAAAATGFLPSTREITLNDGATSNVVLELLPDRSWHPAPVSRPEPDRRQAAPTAVTDGGMGPAPIVAFVVGGIGLGAGILGGSIVAVDSSDLSKSCGADRVCPPGKQSELSWAKTWATVASVGFGVAGAGLGTGTLLLLLGKHETHPSTEAKIHPVVGLLYLGCEGVL